MMGYLTQKVSTVFSNIKKKQPKDVMQEHACWKNHDGSSGSTKAAVRGALVVELFSKHVNVAKLCCDDDDDDSSICADCQWCNEDFMENNSVLVVPQVPKKVGINQADMQVRPDKGSFQLMSLWHSLLRILTIAGKV
jgi:hypothetical protein